MEIFRIEFVNPFSVDRNYKQSLVVILSIHIKQLPDTLMEANHKEQLIFLNTP